jgi:hypothetical protein
MEMFKIVIQDIDTKELFRQEREKDLASCTGCAFDKDATRCSNTPMDCGQVGAIWVAIESH